MKGIDRLKWDLNIAHVKSPHNVHEQSVIQGVILSWDCLPQSTHQCCI